MLESEEINLNHLTINQDFYQDFANAKVLSNDPFVCVIDEFLSPGLCDHLIALATPSMERATVVQNGQREVSDTRTNQFTFLDKSIDKQLYALIEKISSMLHMPIDHAEALQLINYQHDQFYIPHFDTFNPDDPNQNCFIGKSGQRIATALMYLNDVKHGGETNFPELGFEVKAKKGRLVVFQSCHDNTNQPNAKSLHGSRPVEAGEKWAANLWFRENRFIA